MLVACVGNLEDNESPLGEEVQVGKKNEDEGAGVEVPHSIIFHEHQAGHKGDHACDQSCHLQLIVRLLLVGLQMYLDSDGNRQNKYSVEDSEGYGHEEGDQDYDLPDTAHELPVECSLSQPLVEDEEVLLHFIRLYFVDVFVEQHKCEDWAPDHPHNN